MWLIGEKADAMNWRSYLFYKYGLLYFYLIDIVDGGIVCKVRSLDVRVDASLYSNTMYCEYGHLKVLTTI